MGDMDKMGILLEYAREGLLPLSWMISSAYVLRLLGFNKLMTNLYNDIGLPWLKSKMQRSDERERDRIANYVSDKAAADIIYGRYVSVGRHLIGVAWAALSDLRGGYVTEDKITDRLRVGTRDLFQNAKEALGDHIAYSSRTCLSVHFEGLEEADILGFYAPISAAIVELKELGHRLGYEELRLTVLMQTDTMMADAMDMILTNRKTEENGTTRGRDKRK